MEALYVKWYILSRQWIEGVLQNSLYADPPAPLIYFF